MLHMDISSNNNAKVSEFFHLTGMDKNRLLPFVFRSLAFSDIFLVFLTHYYQHSYYFVLVNFIIVANRDIRFCLPDIAYININNNCTKNKLWICIFDSEPLCPDPKDQASAIQQRIWSLNKVRITYYMEIHNLNTYRLTTTPSRIALTSNTEEIDK